MKVTVTQEMIDKGIPGDPCYCPIALAFKELGYEGASVDDECADVHKQGEAFSETYYLPDEARSFITTFDATSGKGEPFEFEVEESES